MKLVFCVGFGFLICAGMVAWAMYSASLKDKKIKEKELIYIISFIFSLTGLALVFGALLMKIGFANGIFH